MEYFVRAIVMLLLFIFIGVGMIITPILINYERKKKPGLVQNNRWIVKWEKHKQEHPFLIKDSIAEADKVFYEVLDLLNYLPLENVVLSLTDSRSIVFRAYLQGGNLIFHLETFFINDENEEITAGVTIYENGELQTKEYGKLGYVLGFLRSFYLT